METLRPVSGLMPPKLPLFWFVLKAEGLLPPLVLMVFNSEGFFGVPDAYGDYYYFRISQFS